MTEFTGTKKCKHCQIEKPVSEYHKVGGGKWLQPYCKPCDKARKRKHYEENLDKYRESKKTYIQSNKDLISIRKRKYYESNKEKILQYQKEYSANNVDKIRERNYKKRDRINEMAKENRRKNIDHYLKKEKEYRERKTDAQRERDRIKKREWEIKNKDIITEKYKIRKRKNRREWCNKKSSQDVSFRILKNLRSRTYYALKKIKAVKSETTENFLGCSIEQFKKHFQSLFTDGMTWELFMGGKIHIDHIKPCSAFDLTNPEEQKKCFHYTNLQPLFWYDNLKKGDKYQA